MSSKISMGISGERGLSGRSRRRVAAWLGAAALITMAGAGLVWVGNEAAPEDSSVGGKTPQLMGRPLDKVGNRCPMARDASTVTELRNRAKPPIHLPAGMQPTDMWTCGQTPLLMFGKIQVLFDDGWDKIDPVEKWTALVEDDGGRIESIGGRPAYVHPGTPGTRSGVQFVANGTSILILSEPDIPVEKLVAFAKKIPLPEEKPHDYVPFDPRTDPDLNPPADPDRCHIDAIENCE